MKRLLVSACAIVVTVACGASEEQKAAERAAAEVKQAADALAKTAESGSAGAAQGLQDFAKAMEGMAAATGADGKPIEPVSFQTLQAVLPEMPGWERGSPTGERMTMPVSFSQTEVDYTKGDSRVSVKIVDSALSQLLLSPWAMFLAAGYEKQTGDGYEKSVSVGGHPGFERWSTSNKSGELNLVVNKRFLVTIEGDTIADTKVLHEFASKVDIGRLAAAK